MLMPHRPLISRSRVASLLLHLVVAAVVLTVLLGASVALVLSPAVILLVLLRHGIAPGEALIARLRRRWAARRPRAAVSLPHPRLRIVVRRAGRTLAMALAMRPPPRVAPSPS